MINNVPYSIKIENVKKQYRLGQIGGGTLRGDLSSWWARKCGKEDPNVKIGSVARVRGGTFMALNGMITYNKFRKFNPNSFPKA